jgi:hypothetical protein
MMNKDSYHDYGAAPMKAEGESVSYETVQRTPDEMIAVLRDQLMDARKTASKYRRVQQLAKNQQLMVATRNGFTLVEDLDEFMDTTARSPLTRDTIVKEALTLMEQAFDDNYAMTKAAS